MGEVSTSSLELMTVMVFVVWACDSSPLSGMHEMVIRIQFSDHESCMECIEFDLFPHIPLFLFHNRLCGTYQFSFSSLLCLKVVGEHKRSVEATLSELGVSLKPSTYQLNAKPLLKAVMAAVLGNPTAALVEMIIRHLPSPLDAAKDKVGRWSGYHFCG